MKKVFLSLFTLIVILLVPSVVLSASAIPETKPGNVTVSIKALSETAITIFRNQDEVMLCWFNTSGENIYLYEVKDTVGNLSYTDGDMGEDKSFDVVAGISGDYVFSFRNDSNDDSIITIFYEAVPDYLDTTEEEEQQKMFLCIVLLIFAIILVIGVLRRWKSNKDDDKYEISNLEDFTKDWDKYF